MVLLIGIEYYFGVISFFEHFNNLVYRIMTYPFILVIG